MGIKIALIAYEMEAFMEDIKKDKDREHLSEIGGTNPGGESTKEKQNPGLTPERKSDVLPENSGEQGGNLDKSQAV